MQQLYNQWNHPHPCAGQMPNSPLQDECTIEGPKSNPFEPLSYEDACAMADALDLPDSDWLLINSAYNLVE